MPGRRAVFLDRDGVLVDTVTQPRGEVAPMSLDEFRIAGSAAAVASRLRAAGFVLIVFTNQPEIARGRLAFETVAAMHERLRAAVPLDDIFVCAHDDASGCDCRKPRPGMLREAAAKWDIDLARSFVVGDRWRDIDAGRAAGCYTILLERPYSQCATADARVTALTAVVDVVLAREARERIHV